MTCRHLTRPNWREYCTTCGMWAGLPPHCTINETERYIEKEPVLTRKPRRGNKGKVAARRQREINTMVEKGKASSYVYYRPVAEALAAAGLT